jgi:hypothetical protein
MPLYVPFYASHHFTRKAATKTIEAVKLNVAQSGMLPPLASAD